MRLLGLSRLIDRMSGERYSDRDAKSGQQHSEAPQAAVWIVRSAV